MPSNANEGAQLTVINTEHIIATGIAPGNYTFEIDSTPFLLGDKWELRVYKKLRAASSYAVAYKGSYAHVQGEPILISIPVSIAINAQVSLKQTAGTVRTIDWAVVDMS